MPSEILWIQTPPHYNDRGETGTSYTVFSDSQVTIFQILHKVCGPAQILARAAIKVS